MTNLRFSISSFSLSPMFPTARGPCCKISPFKVEPPLSFLAISCENGSLIYYMNLAAALDKLCHAKLTNSLKCTREAFIPASIYRKYMMRSTTGNRIQGSHSFRQAPLQRLIVNREGVGGEQDYLDRKDAVTISPGHAASLAAASPPYPRLGTTLRSTIPYMKGRSNRPGRKPYE